MKITSSQYAKALFGALKDTAPKEQDRIVNNFLKLLVRNNALKQFGDILPRFEEYDRQERGVENVEVVTFYPISVEIKHKIMRKMEEVTSKKIILKERTDESILGGIIIKFNDYLYDASLRARIKRLGRSFV